MIIDFYNTGGGGGSDVKVQPTKNITITSNGESTVQADDGYDVIKQVNITANIADDTFRDFCNGTLNHVAIPDGVTETAPYLLYGRQIDVLSLPSTLTKIGDFFMCDAKGITDINFPDDSLEKIGAHAFQNMTLTSVTITKKVKEIGSNCFQNCTGLTDIYFSEQGSALEKLGSFCFAGTAISSITLPDTLTTVEGETFYGCTNLKNVTIGSSVTSLGWADFAETSLQVLKLTNPNMTKYGACLDRATALPEKILVPAGSKATYTDSSLDGNWAAYADIIEEY